MRKFLDLPSDCAIDTDDLILAWSADLPQELSGLLPESRQTVVTDLLSKGLVSGVANDTREQILNRLRGVPGIDVDVAFGVAVTRYTDKEFQTDRRLPNAPVVNVGDRVELCNNDRLVVTRIDGQVGWGHPVRSPSSPRPFPLNAVRAVTQMVASGKPNIADLASGFIRDRFTDRDGRILLRRWREGFHSWQPTSYRHMPLTDVQALLLEWLRANHPNHVGSARRVLETLGAAGLCHVPSDVTPPCWIDGSQFHAAPSCISFANGVLDVGALINSFHEPVLLPGTPLFFSVNGRAYRFDQTARCDRWEAFLEEVLPDAQVRALMQEIAGYLLIPNTSLQRFFVFVGDGANGKSVLAEILTDLLGAQNVCCVSLSRFGERFSLHPLATALANIVSECPVADSRSAMRVAEDLIKAIVAGEPITIERKNQDTYNARPTARLVFLANDLPYLGDRSDGIWRRLIVVPFNVTIPPERQNPHLAREIINAELPGVFNWALVGLRRLLERGRFEEPPACQAVKEEHRQHSAPEMVFFDDHVTVGTANDFVPSSDLYATYRTHMSLSGHTHMMTEGNLTKALRRRFSNCQPERRTIDGRRVRGIVGIVFHPHGKSEE